MQSAAAASFQPTELSLLFCHFCCHHCMQCFNQIMTGIYFMQAMGICVLLVKRFNFALLLLPLIVATVAFHVVNLSLFKRPWTLMSLKEAAVLDARDHVSECVVEIERCMY